jgi:hypothetical protein
LFFHPGIGGTRQRRRQAPTGRMLHFYSNFADVVKSELFFFRIHIKTGCNLQLTKIDTRAMRLQTPGPRMHKMTGIHPVGSIHMG